MDDFARQRMEREPVVPLIEIEAFEGEMRRVAERAIARSGRVPNQARAMANHGAIGPSVRKFFEDLHENSRLPVELRFLVRYRVSTLNLCLYCSAHQVHFLTKFGISREKITGIAEYETHPAFDERERAALAMAEAMTLDAANISDAVVDRFKAAFTPAERVEIAVVTAAMGFMNTVNDALRIPIEEEATDLVGQGVEMSRIKAPD